MLAVASETVRWTDQTSRKSIDEVRDFGCLQMLGNGRYLSSRSDQTLAAAIGQKRINRSNYL